MPRKLKIVVPDLPDMFAIAINGKIKTFDSDSVYPSRIYMTERQTCNRIHSNLRMNYKSIFYKRKKITIFKVGTEKNLNSALENIIHLVGLKMMVTRQLTEVAPFKWVIENNLNEKDSVIIRHEYSDPYEHETDADYTSFVNSLKKSLKELGIKFRPAPKQGYVYFYSESDYNLAKLAGAIPNNWETTYINDCVQEFENDKKYLRERLTIVNQSDYRK